MITKIINYVDFDGENQQEVANFHLSETELARMSVSVDGGMEAYLRKIVEEKDTKKIFDIFEEIVQKSYGRREGKRFNKDPKYLEEFMQTEAYSELCMSLLSDEDEAANFIKGVLPAKISSQIADQIDSETAKLTEK